MVAEAEFRGGRKGLRERRRKNGAASYGSYVVDGMMISRGEYGRVVS